MSVELVSNTTGIANADECAFNTRIVASSNKVFFQANKSVGLSKLYSFDGTTLTQLQNTNSQAASDSPNLAYAQVAGSFLYYTSVNTSGATKLYKTDGSTVTQVSNTREDNTAGDDPTILQVMGNSVYFSSKNSAGFTKVYKTDGASVVRLSNTTNSENSDDMILFSKGSAVLDGALYFVAVDVAGSNALYRTDGSTITRISDTSGSLDDVKDLFIDETYVYFSALNSAGHRKLYMTDGSRVVQLSDNVSGGNDDPICSVKMGSFVFCSMKNSAGLTKLFSICERSQAGCTD